MFFKLYAIALPVFFAIDMVWLGLVAKDFYRGQIGSLMKTDFNWTAAILFYLLFIGVLIFFVIAPAVEKKSWMDALLIGALFGFMTYATYDLTNLATLKGWTTKLVVVDLLWGAVLTAGVAGLAYWILQRG